MEKQITFESAHAAALELKPAVGGLAVYLKFIAKMSRGAAKAMDAEYAVYGTDSLPKPGWTKMDSDFMARNVGLTFDVKSIGKGPKAFHLELNCPLVDKFVFARIGGKKKGKGAYVACKARALVDGRYQDVLEFLVASGSADGVLVLKQREEQQPPQPILEKPDGTAKSNDEIFGTRTIEVESGVDSGEVEIINEATSDAQIIPEIIPAEPPSEIRVAYDEELKRPDYYARVRVVLLESGYLAAWWLRLGPAKRALVNESGEMPPKEADAPFIGYATPNHAICQALNRIASHARVTLRSAIDDDEAKLRTPCARVVAWANEKLAAVEVLAKAN